MLLFGRVPEGSLLFATHACERLFVTGRTDGRPMGRFLRVTVVDLFSIGSRAIFQLLLVLLKIFMKCGLDEIMAHCFFCDSYYWRGITILLKLLRKPTLVGGRCLSHSLVIVQDQVRLFSIFPIVEFDFDLGLSISATSSYDPISVDPDPPQT